jgi:hypothetical protein
MTDNTTEIDLESLWNESNDEGTIVSQEETTADEPQVDDSDVVEDDVGEEDTEEEVSEEDESEEDQEVDYKALYERAQN